MMNKNEKGFSLVIVIIFMSIAALFIGYLMGNWLISFLVDDQRAEQAADNQVKIENSTQKNKPAENNLTTPSQENNILDSAAKESEADRTEAKITKKNEALQDESKKQAANKEDQSNSTANKTSSSSSLNGKYGVQIGAFANYSNALKLKEKVIKMGYNVIISDSTPHQVKVAAYQTREKAEKIEAELEARGYNGFIVIEE